MGMIKNFVGKARRGYIISSRPRMQTIQQIVQPLVEQEVQIIQPQVQSATIPVRVEMIPPQPVPIRVEPISVPVIIQTRQTPTEVKGSLELTPRKKEIKIEGFEIPKSFERIKIGKLAEEETEKSLTLTYPLIPRKPAKGETVFAYAKIFWDTQANKYVYQLVEPKITENLKESFKKIKDLLEQKLDIDFFRLNKSEAKEYLRKNVEELSGYFGIKVSNEEKNILQYYIERDFIGLSMIEPLMNDENIEDVSCDGIGIPIFIYHRNPSIGSVETNVMFNDPEELDSFLIRLSQLCGKSISVASPIVSGSLPDGSRVQLTLATDIARRGSNFTIRKFTEEPLTPIHLLNYNTLNVQLLAYLWFAVDYGKSILVSGGTASGKTSLLNVLSLFIKPNKKIISIEDTPELKLPHPHWVPSVARSALVVEEGRSIGEIDMFDLLKETLRQRPDYIVLGEVRGKEAYVLFQEMATGHPSLATIHAENLQKLMDRLTTPPIALPSGLLGSLDIIVFLLTVRYKDKHVRRVNEVFEVLGVDENTNKPITNLVFSWNVISDNFDIANKSALLKKISLQTGLTEDQISEELKRRMIVLSWMREKGITNYKDVFNVLNMYYTFPERVLSSIMGET